MTGKKRTKPDPAVTPPCPKQKASLTHSKCAVQMLPRSIRSIKTTFIGQTLVPAWPQYTVGEDLTHTYMKLYDREEWYTAVLCGVKNILTRDEKKNAKSVKQVGDDVSVAITSDIREQIRKAHSQHLTKSEASQPDVVDVDFKGIVIQVKVMAAGMRSLFLRSNEAFLHWINHHLAPAMKECMIGGSQPRAVVGDRVLPKGDGDSRVGVREKVKWAVQQHEWTLMLKKSKVACWRAYTRDKGIDLTVKPIDGEDSNTYHERKLAAFLKACEVWNTIDGSARSRIRLTANATSSAISVIPVGEVCSPCRPHLHEEHGGEDDIDCSPAELGGEENELSSTDEEFDEEDLFGG